MNIAIKKYKIKNKWKIFSDSLLSFNASEFNLYYSSKELPNKRLLLNPFSTEVHFRTGCAMYPRSDFSKSKIIFINLKKFKEIKSTEIFDLDVQYIILEKFIIIENYNELIIYDINSLDIIKTIVLEINNGFMFKFDNHNLISLSNYNNKNILSIYKFDNNNNLVKQSEFIVNKYFEINRYNIDYFSIIYDRENKLIFTLKDKRVIIIRNYKLNLFKLDFD